MALVTLQQVDYGVGGPLLQSLGSIWGAGTGS